MGQGAGAWEGGTNFWNPAVQSGLSEAGAEGALGGSAGTYAGTAAAGAAGAGMTGADWAKLAVGAGGNLLGSALQYQGINKAAGIAQQTGQDQLALQRDMYNKNLELAQPWIAAGQAALPALEAGLSTGGQFNKPYTLADFQGGPQAGLYDFAKGQALSAMGNRAAAGGQAQNTGTTVGAGQLASNLANQYYNTGFNQNQATNAMALGGLQSMANLGTSGTASAIGANQALANNSGNIVGAMGNNAQSAATGQGSLLSGTIGQIANTASSIPHAMQSLANLFGLNPPT